MLGTIVNVNAERGFGFIREDGHSDGQPDVFFHMRELSSGLEFGPHLQEMRVSFTTTTTDKGPRARNITPAI